MKYIESTSMHEITSVHLMFWINIASKEVSLQGGGVRKISSKYIFCHSQIKMKTVNQVRETHRAIGLMTPSHLFHFGKKGCSTVFFRKCNWVLKITDQGIHRTNLALKTWMHFVSSEYKAHRQYQRKDFLNHLAINQSAAIWIRKFIKIKWTANKDLKFKKFLEEANGKSAF